MDQSFGWEEAEAKADRKRDHRSRRRNRGKVMGEDGRSVRLLQELSEREAQRIRAKRQPLPKEGR